MKKISRVIQWLKSCKMSGKSKRNRVVTSKVKENIEVEKRKLKNDGRVLSSCIYIKIIS